jgi:hypothetical protein
LAKLYYQAGITGAVKLSSGDALMAKLDDLGDVFFGVRD